MTPTIVEEAVPPNLGHRRREADLLWYGPSRLLTATINGATVGVIRFAHRLDDPSRGLITDLHVERPFRELGQALIARAESALRSAGVQSVLALMLDGEQRTESFFDVQYTPLRKTVVLSWRLETGQPKPTRAEIATDLLEHIEPEEIAEFIFSSYQPYWQWWKETGNDEPLGRVEYPANRPTESLSIGKQRNRARVVEQLQQFNVGTPQRMVIARQRGHIVGLCDAKADPDDSMDWGVLIARDHGGRQIGSALLGPALQWLRDQGLKTAQVTTTSGLDDYDPTVYLYILVGGAQIRGEFLVLRKRILG